MPLRCRNFDDDGRPIHKGCTKGSNCAFLHPDNPAWEQAIRRQNSDVNSNRSSGPSNSRENANRTSWGGPSKAASKDWDTNLWGSSSGTLKKTDDNSTTRKRDSTIVRKVSISKSSNWGGSSDWNKASEKDETSKWGAQSKSEEGLSWGTTDATSGWDADRNMGWGGGGEGGGWGDGGGSEGWGGGKTGDNNSTVPNGNDQKGKGKRDEDVEMRQASPPRTAGSFDPISLNYNKPESAAPPTQNTLPPSTIPLRPARPPPLPLPSRQKKTQIFEDGSLKKLALQCLKRPDKDAEQVQEKSISPSIKTVHGPKGRVDLFSQVIKHTSTVVLLQVELQRAQRDLARWKRTQESAQYERASHSTRVILDHHRVELNLRVQEAKRRLDRALAALVELPDFASQMKTPVPIITTQTIAAYTAELRDWFSDLELHKRILMEKAAAEADLPPAPLQEDSARPVEEPQLTARQLVERGNWSWNDIKNAANELDTRVLTTAEYLYSDVYTTISDLKDQTAGLQEPPRVNHHPLPTREKQLDTLSSTSGLVGDNISAQANRAADLISKVHELEQELEQLESEKRAMDSLCAEAEVHFSQFEQWMQDDTAKIDDMTEQLRTLHLRHHKAPKTPTATLQPTKLDGILLRMQPAVIGQLEKEVQPVFDALRSRCLENHEGMKRLVEELVAPALVMTDDICRRVSAMTFEGSK